MGSTYRRTLFGGVVINAESYTGTFWGNLLKRNLINFRDPQGFSKTNLIKTTYFEDDLVVYFFKKIKVSKHVRR